MPRPEDAHVPRSSVPERAGGKRATAVHVSVADFAELGKLISDLGDAEMMARA